MVCTWDEAVLVQEVSELCAVLSRLVKGLLEEDGTADELAQPWGRDEQLTVCAAVQLGVLQSDGVQSLSAGGVGLVHGQDPTALGGHLLLRARSKTLSCLISTLAVWPASPSAQSRTAARERLTAVAMSSSS